MLMDTAASISDVDILLLVGDISTLQDHVLYLNMLVDHVLYLNMLVDHVLYLNMLVDPTASISDVAVLLSVS